MFGTIGPKELLIIFGVALLIFGPTRIPQVGRGVGKAFKEYKGLKKDLTEDIEGTVKETKDIVEDKNE